jgi:hypothetical protein
LYGCKQNQGAIHKTTNLVILRSSVSQPYTTYDNLIREMYYKRVRQLSLRSAKEGGGMLWGQLGLSIIADGAYVGLRVMDLKGLVDKTKSLSYNNQECRNDEINFDVIEDPSDKKGVVKLACHMANKCSKSQTHMYCYEGGNDFKSRIIIQGTPYITVDPNRHIGHNKISKFTIDLMKLTGCPDPRKGKPGNNGLRRDAIRNLVEAKCGAAIRQASCRHGSEDMQVCYTDITPEIIDGKYSAQMLDSVVVARMLDRVNPDRLKSRLNGEELERKQKVDGYCSSVVPNPGTMLLYMLGYETMYDTLEEAKEKYLARQGGATELAEVPCGT